MKAETARACCHSRRAKMSPRKGVSEIKDKMLTASLKLAFRHGGFDTVVTSSEAIVQGGCNDPPATMEIQPRPGGATRIPIAGDDSFVVWLSDEEKVVVAAKLFASAAVEPATTHMKNSASRTQLGIPICPPPHFWLLSATALPIARRQQAFVVRIEAMTQFK